MAQILLLKIDTDGVPLEMNSTSDDITLNSFTIQGGGPVLSGTGLDLNTQSATDATSFQVTNPATGYLNQTAGNLVFDNIMAKDRSNTMTTAADILFPVVTDTSGQLDAFRLPQVAGIPTATPTTSGEGFLVWDSADDKLFAWTGSAWEDLSIVQAANAIDDTYTAGVILTATNAVYLSASNTVSKALADSSAASRLLGFATAGAAAAAPVNVRKIGKLGGFSLLTAGARYYVDPSTAGAITATTPIGSGNTIVQAGYAATASVLDIQIQQLGRRA